MKRRAGRTAAVVVMVALVVIPLRSAIGDGEAPPATRPAGMWPVPTPTAISSDCTGQATPGLYMPHRRPDDLLRLAGKHTVSLGVYVPPDLESAGGGYALWAGAQLRARAARQFRRMVDAAAAEGITLRLLSGYRSCETQRAIFHGFVSTIGLREAERRSARPGHSEHQLGLGADIAGPGTGYTLSPSFGETAEFRWLARRAHEFGFVLSYPAGAAAEFITGYMYEPWHWRFIGQGHAARFVAARAATGITLNRWLLIEDRRAARRR